MKASDTVRIFVCVAMVWGSARCVEARSLTRQIEGFFGPSGMVLDVGVSPTGEPLQTAQFSSASLATLGIVVQMLASNAVEVPALSTAPGLTFRYDPETQLFERSSVSLGPVFVERAETLGRGKFDVGVSYLFADFEEWKGLELDQLAFALPAHPTSWPKYSEADMRGKLNGRLPPLESLFCSSSPEGRADDFAFSSAGTKSPPWE